MTTKTEISTNPKTVLELDNFNPMRADLQKFADERKKLEIKGIDDKEGYALVHKARMELVKKRTQVIEKERVKIVTPANEFVSKINAEAKVLVGIVKEVENELYEKEKAIDEEKEKIKREKAAAAEKIIQDRITAFAEWDYNPDYIFVKMLDDKKFAELLEQAKKNYEIKKEKEKEQKEIERIIDIIKNTDEISGSKGLDNIVIGVELLKNEEIKKALSEQEEKIKAREIIANQEAEKQKLEDEKAKQNEERQKLLKEKIDFAIEKINSFTTIEEVDNYYNSFVEHEYIQDKLLDSYKIKMASFEKKEEPKKEEKKVEIIVEKKPIQKTEKLLQTNETTERYKEFLKGLGINNSNKNDFEIIKNDEEKTITIKKIIGVFNY